MNNIIIILLLSLIFGLTMKLCDLMDEHGLRWFRGDAILFGIIWGFFGAMLITSNNTVANFVLAMMVAFIIRKRIDSYPHTIATGIVLISFLNIASVEPFTFWFFLVAIGLFGAIRDYYGNTRKTKDWLFWLNEPAWYYLIPPLLYSYLTGNWLISGVSIIYIAGYDWIKYYYQGFTKNNTSVRP